MDTGTLYWVIMVVWLLFGFWTNWPAQGTKPWPLGGHIVLWLLLALLGWKVFGPILR